MTWNIGHRGAAGLEPENTLRSFRRAEEEGADALEMDLRVTRDGHLVVLHDPTVDRTTNGTGPVHGLTLAEVQRLDGGLGERVPTFGEVLEATALPLHAELKVEEAAEPLTRVILEEDVAGRVTPISFDPEALRRVKRVLPDQPVGLILSGAPPDAAELARSVGADLVSLEWAYLNAEAVERCRRAGLKVTAWTVNEPGQMRRVIELGVDGIVTDRPDLLARTISARER
ncbi:MAG: glycerophosphodiester phosphodiesterase [Actinomycetota bacterium]|nr:glycerophosphodiester phosphodiesterase [Actinomycetota bacterium]MDP9487682.1 glycerophosphodiester phosphodiesterase [Actinomycetota bacterium]